MKKTKIAVITFARSSTTYAPSTPETAPLAPRFDPCLLGRAEVERHERLDARGDESEAR